MCNRLLVEENLIESLESETHVWFCCPDKITDEVVLDEYLSILSNEERKKYQRFHFKKDSHSYLVSHALVRKVLSRYCNVQPEAWGFSFNRHGKPEISSSMKCPNIKFNLSHTDGMSACVVSLNNDCGVDVENIHRKNKLHAVAERMFAEQETKIVSECDESEMQNKFFDFWTLREAYVKAIGTGLGGSSKEFYFTIDVADGKNKRVAKINFQDKRKEGYTVWQFSLLEPSFDHVAAVAVVVDADTGEEKKLVTQKIQL
jgi:4'-phosphopantetheinyl transferase